MKNITKYRTAIILVMLGVFFAHLSNEQDKWHDIELAAMLKPVNNSDLSFMRK